MKQFKSIILLTGLSSAIVIFWLAPGVNKADADYVRIYEDTSTKPENVQTSTVIPEAEKPVKKYIRETIKAEATLEDLEAEMFSRAIHFHEHELVIDSFYIVDVDTSLNEVQPSTEIQLSDLNPVTQPEVLIADSISLN